MTLVIIIRTVWSWKEEEEDTHYPGSGQDPEAVAPVPGEAWGSNIARFPPWEDPVASAGSGTPSARGCLEQ